MRSTPGCPLQLLSPACYVGFAFKRGLLRGAGAASPPGCGAGDVGAGAATGAGAGAGAATGAGVAGGAGSGVSGAGAGACGCDTTVSARGDAGASGSPSALSFVTSVMLELTAMITGSPPKAPDAELTPPLATMTFGEAAFSDRSTAFFRHKHMLSSAATSRFFSSYFFRPAPQVRGSFTKCL